MAGSHRICCCSGSGPAGGCFTNPTAAARLDVAGGYSIKWYDGGGPLSYEEEMSIAGYSTGTFGQNADGDVLVSYNPTKWFFISTGRLRYPTSPTNPNWQPINAVWIGFTRRCNCLRNWNTFGISISPPIFGGNSFTTVRPFGGVLRIGGSAGALTETFFGIESAQSASGGVQWHDNSTITGSGGPNASITIGGRKHAILNSNNSLLAEAEGALTASLSGFAEGPFGSTRCNPGQSPGTTDTSLGGPVGPVTNTIALARALRRAA